jgi:hypothetical protein
MLEKIAPPHFDLWARPRLLQAQCVHQLIFQEDRNAVADPLPLSAVEHRSRVATLAPTSAGMISSRMVGNELVEHGRHLELLIVGESSEPIRLFPSSNSARRTSNPQQSRRPSRS